MQSEILFQRCTVCRTLKPSGDFYMSGSRKRRTLHTHCKKCFNEKVKAYQAGNGKTQHAKSVFRYSQTPAGIASSRSKALRYHYSTKGQERLKLPETRIKILARSALNHAVRDGRISKPTACTECKNTHSRIHGHHYLGYGVNHWLDVRWLCPRCHKFAESAQVTHII